MGRPRVTPSDYAVLRAVLVRDEGLRLKPYTDSTGHLTIGYGRDLTDDGISQAEASNLLLNDMTAAVSDLQRTFPFVQTLDSVRQVVLAAMCFNMGVGALAGFRDMWAALRAGDYNAAAEAMLASEWATQVGARATRYAASMAAGEIK